MTAEFVIEVAHPGCHTCEWLAAEATDCAAKYDTPARTSVDGKHGAVAERIIR